MWTERYRDAGEFEIVDQVSSGLMTFLPLGTLISHMNSSEIMFVENHEIIDDESEDPTIKVTGRSLEAYLENRIVGSNKIRANSIFAGYSLAVATTWAQAVTLINDHIANSSYPNDVITELSAISAVSGITGTSEARIVNPDTVYKAVMDLLNIDDCGIKVIRKNNFGLPNGSTTQNTLCIHNGVNRTNTVIFSWKEGDLDAADYLWTDKPMKNSAMVVGRYVNTFVDTAGMNNYNRKTMLVDGSDIDGNLTAPPTGTALTTIVGQMQTRGRQALQSQNRITITRADISDISKYHYRTDFSVGDLVSLDGNFGQIATMRVTEYVEIQDETGQSGHPTLSIPGAVS